MVHRHQQLQERLVVYSSNIIHLSRSFDFSDYATKYLSNQLIRSACASALNYGEAQGAESRQDFIHKMRLSLKELRESQVNLDIIERSGITTKPELVKNCQRETGELVAIFAKSIETARSKQR